MPVSDEFPLAEADRSASIEAAEPEPAPAEEPEDTGSLKALWAQLSDFGLAEPVSRYGTHLAALILAVIVLWAMGQFYLNEQAVELEIPQRAAQAASRGELLREVGQQEEQPEDELPAVTLPELAATDEFSGGITRLALLYTTIPKRPRVDVIEYEVQPGDTVFGIAERFGLKPESILWGNREVLNDDPHALFAGQVLKILPVDGTYHRWSAGENFTKVAEFYGVSPEDILNWPGNLIDIFNFDLDDPQIAADTWLIVPGGTREFVNWGPPIITRSDPAVARTYGPGYCGSVFDGAVGTGTFVWPTVSRHLSGYDFSPSTNHSGIDLAGPAGNSVFAADTGVVVFAGWSNFGYGNLVVLDHGNGWQTLYAHLDAYYVFCGQSIFQSAALGTVGTTGNSSGPHLHYEMMYNGAKVNPWNFISP